MTKIQAKYYDIYSIGIEWMPALLGGDRSNLTDRQNYQLNLWLRRFVPVIYFRKTIDAVQIIDVDRVTGQRGACYYLEVMAYPTHITLSEIDENIAGRLITIGYTYNKRMREIFYSVS